MLKRRRTQKTDYKQRLALLKSGMPRLVVRRTLNHIHVQIAEFLVEGDQIILNDSSKSLRKYGWLGHSGNISAAYLTGMLVGLKAKQLGINSVILDIGLQTSVKGSSIFAVAAGANDAGLHVPVGDVTPSKERIEGKHIADYAGALKKNDINKYKKQFSAYLKNNLEPEKIVEHFNDVKARILAEFGSEIKSKKEVVA